MAVLNYFHSQNCVFVTIFCGFSKKVMPKKSVRSPRKYLGISIIQKKERCNMIFVDKMILILDKMIFVSRYQLESLYL